MGKEKQKNFTKPDFLLKRKGIVGKRTGDGRKIIQGVEREMDCIIIIIIS